MSRQCRQGIIRCRDQLEGMLTSFGDVLYTVGYHMRYMGHRTSCTWCIAASGRFGTKPAPPLQSYQIRSKPSMCLTWYGSQTLTTDRFYIRTYTLSNCRRRNKSERRLFLPETPRQPLPTSRFPLLHKMATASRNLTLTDFEVQLLLNIQVMNSPRNSLARARSKNLIQTHYLDI